MKPWLFSLAGIPVLGAGIGLQWWMNQWWACDPMPEVTCQDLLPVMPLLVMTIGAGMIVFGASASMEPARYRQDIQDVNKVVVDKHRWEEGQEAIRVLSVLDEGPLHPRTADMTKAKMLVTDFHNWMIDRVWRRNK